MPRIAPGQAPTITIPGLRRRHPSGWGLQDPHLLRVEGTFGPGHVRAVEADPRVRAVEIDDRADEGAVPDLSLLGRLPQVVAVRIRSRRVRDLSVLPRLTWVEELDLDCPAADLPSLATMTSLVQAQVVVRRNVVAAADAPHLVRVFLQGFPSATLEPLAGHPTLERVGVQSAVLETATGAARIPRLQRLVLHSSGRVRSAEGVEAHPRLRRLDFIHCPALTSLDPVGALPRLHCFTASDCGEIESVAPLLRCRALRQVYLGGDTRFRDGRVVCVEELPRLHLFSLNGRRHYDVRTRALGARIFARRPRRAGD